MHRLLLQTGFATQHSPPIVLSQLVSAHTKSEFGILDCAGQLPREEHVGFGVQQVLELQVVVLFGWHVGGSFDPHCPQHVSFSGSQGLAAPTHVPPGGGGGGGGGGGDATFL